MNRRPDKPYICISAVIGVAAVLAWGASHIRTYAQSPVETIAIDVSRPGAAIPRGLFGLFFEDINFAADGGLYPELVKNRSFEFTEPLAGWSKNFNSEGELIALDEGGLNENNRHYLRLRSQSPAGFSIANSGFRGMGVNSGADYVFSAWVRLPKGAGPKTVRATLVAPGGRGAGRGAGGNLGEATLTGFNGQWKRYEAVLKASTTVANARLQLTVGEPGDLDLDMVSLFPKDTWKNRPNGLRRDLVQLLADMKPGFLRFPGGCIVEGRRLALRYQWKKTVGDISERRSLINRWNDENARVAPDYYQSFGLGFYEYFQLAEDIGASPLPILNCGMACQFNSGELAQLDQLDEYIQDALDLIEFANGATNTRWGALRAKLGHPAPFNLKMIGVGNEQWGKAYVDRYKVFAGAIKAKHPEIRLVTSAGPSPSGPLFEYLWPQMRELKADLVDEHYYQPPQWFLDNSRRYDNYPRTGPKVFAGEYAAHQPRSEKQLGRGGGRSRLHDGTRAERGHRGDGVLCAAARARRCMAVGPGPDLVRQSALFRHAQLLCPEALRHQPREPHPSGRHGQRAEWPLHQRGTRNERARSHLESCELGQDSENHPGFAHGRYRERRGESARAGNGGPGGREQHRKADGRRAPGKERRRVRFLRGTHVRTELAHRPPVADSVKRPDRFSRMPGRHE